MKLVTLLLISGLASICAASRLYVSSYDGNITTLDVTTSASGVSLMWVNATDGCKPKPSWLELDSKTSTLYCIDEGDWDSTESTVSSYRVNQDGSLIQNSKIPIPAGGVSSTVYANGSALAISHYGASALSVISLAQTYNMTIVESQNLTLSKPGPNTERQTAPFLHQALPDPFEKYVFVPALGGDQVHYFKINPETYTLNHANHIALEPGSGPRHGVFYVPPGDGTGATPAIVYYYVVTELTNMIHGYEIKYDANHQITEWTSVYNSTIFGDNIPKGTYAAEIAISPDKQFLVLSSRNDATFNVTNPVPQNSTLLSSDSLVTFEILDEGPQLKKIQQFSAGGSWPRHFSLNQKGDLVAIALQKSHKIVLVKRNVETGLMEGIIAEMDVDGELTSVVWDEAVLKGNGTAIEKPANGTWTWSGPSKTTFLTSVVATLTKTPCELKNGKEENDAESQETPPTDDRKNAEKEEIEVKDIVSEVLNTGDRQETDV